MNTVRFRLLPEHSTAVGVADVALRTVVAATTEGQALIDAALDTGALDAIKTIHEAARCDVELGAVADDLDLDTVRMPDVRDASAAIAATSQRALVEDGFGETITVYRQQRSASAAGGPEGGVVSVSTRRLGYLDQDEFVVALSDVLTYGEALLRGTFAENELHVPADALKRADAIGARAGAALEVTR